MTGEIEERGMRMAEYTHDKDIFGNDVIYGPNGETYFCEKDAFGTDVIYGPDGKVVTHYKDIFGDDVSVTSDGKTYRHVQGNFGDGVTYGPDGETYFHGRDLFGREVVHVPDPGPAPFSDGLPGFGPDGFPEELPGAPAHTQRNVALTCESAEDKHDPGYASRRKDALRPGEKVILDVTYYSEKDYDEHRHYYDALHKYDAEDFTAMQSRIARAVDVLRTKRPAAGYVPGKGWPLARRYRLWTYYPDKDRNNVDDLLEMIYFLREDGSFAVYTYGDEYTRYAAGGEDHVTQGEDLVPKDCSVEDVAKALDFDFFIYERAFPEYRGEECEWIQSGTILGEFGSKWRGARHLAIRRYPQRGAGLLRVLQTLASDPRGEQGELARACAAYGQIEKAVLARRAEQQRRADRAAREWTRAEAERAYAAQLEPRKKAAKRAYWASLALNVLLYTVALLSAGRGGNWVLYAGCAVTVGFAFAYLDGLGKSYSHALPRPLALFLYAAFGMISLLELVLFAFDADGRAVNEVVVMFFYVLLIVLVAGQIICYRLGKRVSRPENAAPSRPVSMADIYALYAAMALVAVVCLTVFGTRIPEGIAFWRRVS